VFRGDREHWLNRWADELALQPVADAAALASGDLERVIVHARRFPEWP
jgi:hypothetical protein